MILENTDKEGNIKMKTHYEPNRADYPPKIPDDNITFIQENNTKFFPCKSLEDRKLVIIINSLDKDEQQ